MGNSKQLFYSEPEGDLFGSAEDCEAELEKQSFAPVKKPSPGKPLPTPNTASTDDLDSLMSGLEPMRPLSKGACAPPPSAQAQSTSLLTIAAGNRSPPPPVSLDNFFSDLEPIQALGRGPPPSAQPRSSILAVDPNQRPLDRFTQLQTAGGFWRLEVNLAGIVGKDLSLLQSCMPASCNQDT